MESLQNWKAWTASLSGVVPTPLNPTYIREEPNDRLSVLSSDGKQVYTILNRVAKEIFHLCDGTRDLPEILHLFTDKYPDQPDEMLARDLMQTLHSLTTNGLVTWKKEGRSMNDPICSDFSAAVNADEAIYLADESRFAEVEEAAARSLSAKQDKSGHRIHFSEFDVEPELENPLVLRQRVFSFTYDFFLLATQSEEITGLIICEPNVNPTNRSVVIKYISCNTPLLAPALNQIAEYYKRSPLKQYATLKINVPSDAPIVQHLDSPDGHLHFTLAGILPNELDSGDVKLFIRKLSEEFL